jgi:DNA-directed RNA polymerase specialized sigma24 family protein
VDFVRAAGTLKHGGPPDASGHQQRHALALADELGQLASPRRTPPDEAIYRETMRIVRVAVGCLAPRARRIVSLHYARGLEIDQIAQRLHTTPNQVKYVLTQAQGELRDRLGSFMGGALTKP